MHIPENKRYFRIGEVSRIIGVEPYVLRFWESEFAQIRPRRADSKHRTYEKKDLKIIIEIKRLLYDEKLTIEGAKRRLKQEISGDSHQRTKFLRDLKGELDDILKALA
jgi:DNA-binding transcriptional MerR regulator